MTFHWIDEDSKQAVADWRAHNRKVAELKQEIRDFRDIFWNPAFPEQKVWARQQIQSIEHELDQMGEEV